MTCPIFCCGSPLNHSPAQHKSSAGHVSDASGREIHVITSTVVPDEAERQADALQGLQGEVKAPSGNRSMSHLSGGSGGPAALGG